MDAAAQVRHRLSSFPLYREQHHVHAICRDGSVYIGYRTKPGLPIHSTHFDAQVSDSFQIICLGPDGKEQTADDIVAQREQGVSEGIKSKANSAFQNFKDKITPSWFK